MSELEFQSELTIMLTNANTIADTCDITKWVGVEKTCGNPCTVLVDLRSYGGTCRKFCELQNRGCQGAWDDTDPEICVPSTVNLGCDAIFPNPQVGHDSDAICECHTKAGQSNCYGSIVHFW